MPSIFVPFFTFPAIKRVYFTFCNKIPIYHPTKAIISCNNCDIAKSNPYPLAYIDIHRSQVGTTSLLYGCIVEAWKAIDQ